MAQRQDPSSEPLSNIKQTLFQKAKSEGFDQVGITKPELKRIHITAFDEFIQKGWHGDMDWMEQKRHRRESPLRLWQDVKSIIMLAMTYGPDENPLSELEKHQQGVISVYAKGKDYHDIIKKKLKNIARWLVSETGAEVKVFVDTAPVMEKPLAMQAGLGWQGKHTNLVSREIGSWGFIGVIYTNLEILKDKPEKDHCGSCQKCLDICPTNAFPKPYQLDARRCISYLTIEHKGSIPYEFREAMGNRIYGCDDCLAICPWNKFAKKAKEQRLRPRAETDNPPLASLLLMDDKAFRERFKGTPIKRTGRNRFLRNCLIAAGNSLDTSLLPIVADLLQDSKEADIVRGAAIWAFSKLATMKEWQEMYQSLYREETNEMLKQEWQISAQEKSAK